MTPAQLEVLVYYYYRTDEILNINAPSIQEAIRVLFRHKVIEYVENNCDCLKVYQTTERGDVWLKEILKTSIPTKKEVWVNGKGEVIK